jgi:ferredoxin-NADP reductase
VLIAGGTGITSVLSQFLGLLSTVHERPSQTLRLVWNVRDASNISWITPLLEQAFALDAMQARRASGPLDTEKNGSSGLDGRIRIDLHVTQGMVDETARNMMIRNEMALASGLKTALHAHVDDQSHRKDGMSEVQTVVHVDAASPVVTRSEAESATATSTEDANSGSHGLSRQAGRFVTFHHGRSDITRVLRERREDVGVVGKSDFGCKKLQDCE